MAIKTIEDIIKQRNIFPTLPIQKQTVETLQNPRPDLSPQEQKIASIREREPEIRTEIERLRVEAEKAIPGIAETVWRTITGLPKTVLPAAKELAVAVYQDPVDSIKAIGRGVLKGAIPFAEKIPILKEIVKPPEKRVPEAIKALEEGFEFAAVIVPYELAEQGALQLMKYAPKIIQSSKAAPYLAKAVGFMGTGQLIYDPDEDESRAERTAMDLTLFGAASLFGGALSKLFSKLKSGNTVSVKEAEAALKEAKTTIGKLRGAKKQLETAGIEVILPEEQKLSTFNWIEPVRETAKADPRAAEIARQGRNAMMDYTYQMGRVAEKIDNYFKGLGKAEFKLFNDALEGRIPKAKVPANIWKYVEAQRELNKLSKDFVQDELGIDTSKWRIPTSRYFHHLFLGRYQIVVNGKTLGFAEKLGEAMERADAVLEKTPTAKILISPKKFTMNEFEATLLSRKAFFRFVSHAKKAGVLDINENDLRILKGVAAIKRARPKFVGALLPRTANLTGYESDPVKVNKILWARLLRKGYWDTTNKEMQRLLERMPKGELRDSMEEYMKTFNNPYRPFYGSKLGGVAPSITTAQAWLKLGFRPISALVNRTQPLTTTYPEIGSYLFKGVVKSHSAEGKRLLEEMSVEGTAAKFEIAAPIVARVTTGIKRFFHPLFMFGKAEGANRVDTALGGYLFAKAKLARHLGKINAFRKEWGLKLFENVEEMAKQYGRDLVSATQYMYDISDYPRAFRTPLGRLVFQFRGFTVNYLYNAKNVLLGKPLGGLELYDFLTPAQKITRAIKFLGANFAIGGLRSIPYATRVGFLVYLFANYPRITRGIFAYLGIDLSTTAGIGDFIPTGIDEVLGVTARDGIKLYQIMTEPDSMKRQQMIASYAPAISRVYEALTMDDTYRNKMKRNRPLVSFSPYERTLYGLGFTPVKLGQARDAINYINLEKKKYADDREFYVDMLVRAIQERDSATLNELIDEMKEQGISVDSRTISDALKKQKSPVPLEMIRTAPKDIRKKLYDFYKQTVGAP